MHKRETFFLLLSIAFIIFSCGDKINNKGYIKTNEKDVYKINYDSYIAGPSIDSEITVSFSNAPQTLNPYRAVSPSEIFLKNALFSSLFYIDPATGLPEKNLIKNYSIMQNGLEYYITLKNNIRFNNNKTLTVDDVISSINLISTVLKDTTIYNSFFINNNTLDIEPLSSFEFLIKLDTPNSNILYALADFPIIPDNIAADLSSDIEKFINYWEIKKEMNVIGSGPYKLEQFDENGMSLQKNNEYFKSDKKGNKLPLTSEVNVKFYASRNNEIMDFVQNETDILSLDDSNYKNMYNYFSKPKLESVKFINTGRRKEKVILAYNSYRTASKSFLKDDKIRGYISFFIKKEFEKLNKKQIKDAESIKIDNGLFTDINNDGILEYKDGNTIFLTLLIPEENKEIISVAYGIKKNLESLGFDLFLDIVPYHIFLEKLFFKYDYDIVLFYYSFEPGIISYLHLLDKNELTFYPFVDDNNKLSNQIDLLLDNSLRAESLKSQSVIIKKLTELLEEKHQLHDVYNENQYYAIKKNIINFKINSSLEDSFNLVTLETMTKTIDSKKRDYN